MPALRPVWRRRLIAGVYAALALAAAVAVNAAVAAWGPSAWDVSESRRRTLTPQTLAVLERLKGPVTVTLFAESEVRTTRERTFNRTAGMLRDLLHQYASHADDFAVERITADTVAGLDLKQRFPDIVAPCVVVSYSVASGEVRHEVLRHEDLAEFHGSVNGRVWAIDFFAEQAVTAALARLVDGQPQTIVYCLTGQGELTLEAESPESTRSLSELADYLALSGLELRSLDISQVARVPVDADAVIVAGPRMAYDKNDLAKLDAYFKHGGGGLVLFDLIQDPQDGAVVASGWEQLLRQYGVLLGEDYVVTTTIDGELSTTTRALAAGPEHELGRLMPRTACDLMQPRSTRLLPEDVSRKTQCIPLLLSDATPRCWAETDVASRNFPQWNDGADLPGPVCLAVAVERLDRLAPEPMMVVVGDAEFLSNRGLTGNGGDAARHFALRTLAWLSGRKRAMHDIPPRRRRPYQLAGTVVEHRKMVWQTTLLLSALIGTVGATVWTVRRQG